MDLNWGGANYCKLTYSSINGLRKNAGKSYLRENKTTGKNAV